MDGRVSSRMNSAIPHRAGKDCALCAAHEKAAERHRTASPARRSRFIPWIVALSLVVVLLPFGDWSRLIALGLFAGLGCGVGIGYRNQVTYLHFAGATLAQATTELRNEADQRVAMVIRQFEWAVNYVANLRDALKRAQDAKATAEASEHRIRRRLHLLERQLYDARMKIGEYSRALGSETPMMEEPAILPTTEELVVPLTWRVFEDNMLTWLRFESAGILPSQIRIMNENQSVIAISARALDTIGEGEQTALVVRAPDDVVAALEGRHTANFAFIGTRSGSRGQALGLAAAAFGIDATSMISFGGGFLFALLVGPLLLLTLVLIAISRWPDDASRSSHPGTMF